MKWKVTDKRFNMACVFLIHFNKFKIIEDTNEKILYQLLDPPDESMLYEGNKCVVIDKFYKLVDSAIRSMFKGRTLNIFEMVSVEILNKLNLYFYTSLFEMVNANLKEMKVSNVVKWINGFDNFEERVKRHYDKFAKGLRIDMGLLERCSNKEYILRTVKKLEDVLFDFLIAKVEDIFYEYVKESKLEHFNFERLILKINDSLFEETTFEEKAAFKFERLKLDKLIIQSIFYTLDKGGRYRTTYLSNILNKINTYIKKSLHKERLEDQSLFIEQFNIFLTSERLSKCEKTLCCITNLLSIKLNRKDLTFIIKERGFKSSKVKEELVEGIFNHFKKQHQMKESRQERQTIYKRLSTFLNCTLFVIKLKRCLKRKVRRTELRKSIFFNKSRTMKDQILDYALLDEIKEIKVGMRIFDSTTYNERYNGNYVTLSVNKY